MSGSTDTKPINVSVKVCALCGTRGASTDLLHASRRIPPVWLLSVFSIPSIAQAHAVSSHLTPSRAVSHYSVLAVCKVVAGGAMVEVILNSTEHDSISLQTVNQFPLGWGIGWGGWGTGPDLCIWQEIGWGLRPGLGLGSGCPPSLHRMPA